MASTGDRIREIRESKGLTQEQLSENAGISKGFLSDVENNNKNLSSQGILRIADALNCSVDYLLRGETKEFADSKPVIIPQALSEAAEDFGLTYAQTLELLQAQQTVIARRSDKTIKELTVQDWKDFREQLSRCLENESETSNPDATLPFSV